MFKYRNVYTFFMKTLYFYVRDGKTYLKIFLNKLESGPKFDFELSKFIPFQQIRKVYIRARLMEYPVKMIKREIRHVNKIRKIGRRVITIYCMEKDEIKAIKKLKRYMKFIGMDPYYVDLIFSRYPV